MTDRPPTVPGWGTTPAGHPVVGVVRGEAVGFACGCGRWQAYVRTPADARAARAAYEAHLPEETRRALHASPSPY